MSIMDVLREKELTSINRSIDFSKRREDLVRQHAKSIKQGIDVPVEVNSIRNMYINMLETYTQKSQFGFIPAITTKQSLTVWSRVEEARKASKCTQERFLKAQFDWFDKHFGKAPEPVQLTTQAAIDRALAFEGKTTGRVVGAILHKSSLANIFKQSEDLLQKMMQAQNCSREQFYRNFVVPGHFTFPAEFLNADPIYNKVKNE